MSLVDEEKWAVDRYSTEQEDVLDVGFVFILLSTWVLISCELKVLS